MAAKRKCPSCGAALRPRFLDCVYRRSIGGKLIPAENTGGKRVIFVCPKCVHAESE